MRLKYDCIIAIIIGKSRTRLAGCGHGWIRGRKFWSPSCSVFRFQDVQTYTTANGYVLYIIILANTVNVVCFCFYTCLYVLLGGEGDGLSSELRQLCDVLLTIPPRGDLQPGVESLNVSVATGKMTTKPTRNGIFVWFLIPVLGVRDVFLAI